MRTVANATQLDNPNNPELSNYWETSPDIQAQIYRQIDNDIKNLCRRLWECGIETRWSCSGRRGHMCSRPTIIIPCGNYTDTLIKTRIEDMMQADGIKNYWLSRVFSHVAGWSGMRDFFMLEIFNPDIDTIAYPIAYRKAD